MTAIYALCCCYHGAQIGIMCCAAGSWVCSTQPIIADYALHIHHMVTQPYLDSNYQRQQNLALQSHPNSLSDPSVLDFGHCCIEWQCQRITFADTLLVAIVVQLMTSILYQLSHRQSSEWLIFLHRQPRRVHTDKNLVGHILWLSL